jgi:hypothetical protein
MKNKKIFLAVLALALVFGLAACPNPAGGGGGSSGGSGGSNDASIIGTWVSTVEGVTDVFKFTSSAYEYFYKEKPTEKGTYTTSGGKLKVTPTQFYGGSLNSMIKEDYDYDAGLTATKWYSKSELLTFFKDMPGAAEMIGAFFDQWECSYSVSGKTLTLSTDSGTSTWTKE